MAEHTAREGSVGQPSGDEELTGRSSARTAPPKIRGQRLCDSRKEGKLDRYGRLWAPGAQNASPPVDVAEPKANHFASTETVGGHEQEHRVVPSTEWVIARDDTKHPANAFPRQRPRRALVDTKAGGDDGGREVRLNTARRPQEPQEAAKRAAETRNGPSAEPRRQSLNKLVDVDDSYRGDASTLRLERPEEVRSDFAIADEC
jgi:hypothetical protein